jgi:hypothetical protein
MIKLRLEETSAERRHELVPRVAGGIADPVVDEREADASRRTPREPRRDRPVEPRCHGAPSSGEIRRIPPDCIRPGRSGSLRLGENFSVMQTLPYVVFGLFRYLYVARRSDRVEEPERIFPADRPILVTVAPLTATAATILAFE